MTIIQWSVDMESSGLEHSSDSSVRVKNKAVLVVYVNKMIIVAGIFRDSRGAHTTETSTKKGEM